MIIDGEKYACEACVRGHRVSNCQHSDRPLQHINKKGRPVSQCSHCRAMRKSRSAHIKCDCGEKTSKCAHLQPTVEGHKETCCCNHGGRCSCSHKKEPALDTVPESDSEGESQTTSTGGRARATARRRRANTVHSDGVLTFDQNGHHKPAQKHNRVSQKCGPYQLNRVNSAHSTSSLGTGADNLLGKGSREAPTGRSRAASTREQRRVKSETASPLMSSNTGFQTLNGNLPPLDLSGIEYPPYMANGSFDLFGSGFNSETDGPMYSAGLSGASVDWSHYDLSDMKGGEFTPSSYSQAGAQSFNGLFDFGSGSEQLPHLANTTSTSGEVSEVEDFMPGGENDFDAFGSSNFMRQGNMMPSSAADLTSIDYDSFYKGTDSGPIAGHGLSMVEDDPAFWMPNYNEGITTMDESPDPLGPAAMTNLWEV
ncbi:Fc.00g038370.m01.CDS01 [Cosmosporella sp. VM-42]